MSRREQNLSRPISVCYKSYTNYATNIPDSGLSRSPTMQELSSSVVARVIPNWHPLGVELGLDVTFLQTLENDYPRDSKRCCTEMFRQWLFQPELTPSWDKLIEALNSSNVAQRKLAQELSEKYTCY